MRREDIKIGMQINIKGFNNISFPITEIDKNTVTIKGIFYDKISLEQIIKIPFSELIDGSFENKKFTLKDFPKWDETILVSNDGNTWFIRSFNSFCDKEIGSIYTRLCAADDMDYDDDGYSIGHCVRWKMYKRFNIL
jgi:hypothetical protein